MCFLDERMAIFDDSAYFTSFCKGQLISKCLYCVFNFFPKNEQKQVDLRFHSSKIEFVCSRLGNDVLKKSFLLFLTFRIEETSWERKCGKIFTQHYKSKNCFWQHFRVHHGGRKISSLQINSFYFLKKEDSSSSTHFRYII